MVPALAAVVVLAGILLVAASLLALRASGADPARARRLAGPRELKVGRLFDDGELPDRPVRISGRIRCRDPLDAGGGERLVAYHRDVEARIAGRWRSVERMREARSFELWDHDGSVTIDPARASEPLIVIPQVWRGDPGELEEPHASAVARLAERAGPATEARAVVRTLNATDRLLVLARPVRDAGGIRLEPPPGGYLITTLALPDAMRLLGGRGRRRAALAVLGIAMGVTLAVAGVIAAALAAVLA